MATNPGVTIVAPQRVSSSGPIRLRVTMIADMKTYYANNGILDKALNMILVRRDLPGLRLVAKLDPHAIMLPDTPLPPPLPGKDPSQEGFITEERELDVLGYGSQHNGAADYYVLASFASWLSRPTPLSVDHNFRRLMGGSVPTLPPITPGDKEKLPLPQQTRGIIARIKPGPMPEIEGAFRTALRPMRYQEDQDPVPFVTVVAAHLIPEGGISTGSFLVDAKRDGEDFIAQFKLPLKSLTPQPKPGRYQVLVFAGNEHSSPLGLLYS